MLSSLLNFIRFVKEKKSEKNPLKKSPSSQQPSSPQKDPPSIDSIAPAPEDEEKTQKQIEVFLKRFLPNIIGFILRKKYYFLFKAYPL